MTPQRPSQTADDLFLAVVGRNPEEQIAHLDEADISDQVRGEVERLLEADRLLESNQSDEFRAAREHTVSYSEGSSAVSGECQKTTRPTIKNGSGPSAGTDEQAPPSGQKEIGKYKILTLLGRGGFGQVWKAYDTTLQRYVALKVPREGISTSTDRRMMEREARAASRFQHPNIVRVYEVSFEDNLPIIASELIDGVTLSQVIEQESLTVRRAVDTCMKLADAIHYAHERGVIHRDLKPANILIDSSGEPHIADFGLAKRDLSDVTLSAHGNVLGTPAYMPPEQARGDAHAADSRSDIYSLGVVLFQMLTSELPFRGDMKVVIQKVLCLDPPNPRSLKPSIPRDVETICLKCLEKSPGRRYQTAQELSDDLQRWLERKPIAARPVSRLERGIRLCSRYPVVSSLALVIALILAVSLTVVTSLWMTANENRTTAVRHLEQRTANFGKTIEAVEAMLTKVIEKEGPEFVEVQQQVIGEALRLYTQLEESAGDDAESLAEAASIQMRIGNLHEVAGQSGEAHAAYIKAIGRFERAMEKGGNSAILSRGLGESYRSLANSLWAVRPLDSAQTKQFRSAIDQAIEIDQSSDECVDRTLALARTYGISAQHHAVVGEYQRAEEEYLIAIHLWEQAVEGKPRSDMVRLSLVWSRHQLADMYFRQSRMQLSKEMHTGLLEERRQLQDALPDSYRFHPSVLVRIPKPDELFSLQRDLAATHRTLGAIAEAEMDDETARKHYQAAVDLLGQVVNNYPHRSSHQFAYSGIHLRLAQLFGRLGDDQAALKHLEKGIENRSEALGADADRKDLLGIAGQYVKAGTLCERLLLHEAACDHYEAASGLYAAALEESVDQELSTEMIRLTLKVFSIHQRQGEMEPARQALVRAQGLYSFMKQSEQSSEGMASALFAVEKLFTRFQVPNAISDVE